MNKKTPGIRAKYNPDEKEKKDLKHVYERRQQMAEARAPWEKIWEEADRQYEMYRAPKTDWRSNITVPTTTAIVESQVAETIDQQIRPRYLPRGNRDRTRSKIFNLVSNYAWDVGRVDVEMFKGVKDAFVRGTGILQDYYRKESRMVQDIVKINDKGEAEYEKRVMSDYDDLFAEVVKLEDFWVDEAARGFFGSYSARDCIRRYIMHIDDFKREFEGNKLWDPFKNAKFVEARIGSGDTNYYEFFKPPERLDKSNEVEVLYYWAKVPIPSRPDFSDSLVIVANDVLIYRGPNPYAHKQLPFVRIVDVMNSHQFYGKGEAKLLESIQEEQQTLRRMVIDRNHLDIDKGFLVSTRETELDEDDLITRPHMMIPVDDPENVKALEYRDVPNSVFWSLSKLDEDATRVTGYSDQMQGAASPGTATEAAILKEATLKRLKNKIWMLKNLSTYRMGVLRESNIRQFYTQPKVVQIVGDASSADYKKEIREAFRANRLKMIKGEPFKEQFRNIRLQDQKLVIGENDIEIKKDRGTHFFEATPEMLTPYHGFFEVDMVPTAEIPVSKPLQQEKMSMLYDRVIQIATATGAYDPVKTTDMLLELHDVNPEDLKPEKSMQEKFDEGNVGKSIELATVENQMILSGQKLPPTPFAPAQHTEVHIATLNSPEVMNIPHDDPNFANLTAHIVGEIQAHEQRQQSAMTQAQGEGGMEYKPPSGPTAIKGNPANSQPPTKGDQVMPQRGQTQQTANMFGGAF